MNRLVILFALLFLFVEAETITNAKEAPPSPNGKTVNVPTAGTLANYISDSEKYSLEELTIIGQLNGTDFRLIRDMAGCDYLGNLTNGVLKRLDLSEASIVAGGEKYLDAEWVHFSSNESAYGGSLAVETSNEISPRLFMCCRFEQIVLPKSIISIGENAFYQCPRLTSISVPEGVLSIGSAAFISCDNLTEAVLPNSLKVLGSWAFAHDKNLQSVNIPDGIIDFGNATLFGCRNLTSIQLPNGLNTIGSQAFEGCVSLSEISIPSTVTKIGHRAFYGCTGFLKITCMVENPILTYEIFDNYNPDLYVPYGTKSSYQKTEEWNQFPNMFELERKLTDISFSDPEVKRICVANWDTNGDGELSETEAATVTDLGDVFKGNKIITTFNDLEYFTGLTAIATAAFDRCENLKSVVVPKNVISLGDYHPFTYCSHLNTIRVADGNKTYDSRGDCNAVIETATNKIVVGSCSTVIPNGVTSIGDAAFSNYDDLVSLTIPEGVKTIGRQAFWGCPNLKSIHIPASVIRIEKECFFGNQSMETMTVDAGNAVYDSRDNCNAIIETSTNTLKEGCYTTLIPNTVEAIGEAAFGARNGLKNVDIPKGITSIGVNAFYDCKNITSVNIPSSVKEINDYAFEDCERLATIHCHIDSPFDISDNVFQLNEGNQIYQKATLYVPYGNRVKYQRAAGWKNFKNIVEMKQKTLTLMVNRCEREYGDDNPVFTFTAEGDEFTGEPAITCEATKESPTGQYPITISKGSIEFDGKITFINAILSVTRVTVTITADDKTMTEGDEVPELTVTYTGFKNNETEDVLIQKPTIRAMGFSSSKPGTYPIYVTGGYAQNYIFNHVDGKLTIKKKEEVVDVWKHTLVINFKDGTQKKYPLKDMSDAQLSGENLIVKTKTSSISHRRADILEFKFINAATDYDHVIFTPNSYTRTYGESNPKFEFTSDGASYTGLPTISCDATSTSPVGTYPIRISQGSVDNDNTTFLQGTLTVTKALLVVTADSKIIVEGDEIPELTVTYDGFVNGETESVLLRKPVAATTATKGCEPGEYPIVVEGGLAENYEFDYQDGLLTVEALTPVVRSHTLVMHLWNGHRERFVLSEQPLFVSSDDKLIVKTKSMSAVYLRSDIREFTFEDTAVDIDIASAANEITFRQMPNGDIFISGLDDGAAVRVHDLNGYTVYTSTAVAGQKLIIPLETRKSGVYLININNKRTIKIQKK